MKYTLFAGLIFSAFIAIAIPAGQLSAIQATPFSKIEIKTATSTKTQTVSDKYSVMVNRFDTVIGQLSGIFGRLVSRAEKIKASGLETAKPDDLSLKADAEIESAKTGLAAMKRAVGIDAFGALATSSKAISEKKVLTDLKKATEDTKSHVVKTYELLIKMLESLRKIEASQTATSSVKIKE